MLNQFLQNGRTCPLRKVTIGVFEHHPVKTTRPGDYTKRRQRRTNQWASTSGRFPWKKKKKTKKGSQKDWSWASTISTNGKAIEAALEREILHPKKRRTISHFARR